MRKFVLAIFTTAALGLSVGNAVAGCSNSTRPTGGGGGSGLDLPSGMPNTGAFSRNNLAVTPSMGVQAWLDVYVPDSGAAGRGVVDVVELVVRSGTGDRILAHDDFDTRWPGDRPWGSWLDASAAGWGRTLSNAEQDHVLANGQITINPLLAPASVPRPLFGHAWDRHWFRDALGPVAPGDLLIVRARVLAEGAACIRVGLDLWNAIDRSDSNLEACFSAPVGAAAGWTWIEAQVVVGSVY